MNESEHTMSKSIKSATPARELSTLERAQFAAMQANSARETYATYLKEISYRFAHMNEEYERVLSYNASEQQQAQNIISHVQQMQQNMRIDLLAKYASEIEKQSSAVAIYRSLLSTDEQAELDQFIARYNAE